MKTPFSGEEISGGRSFFSGKKREKDMGEARRKTWKKCEKRHGRSAKETMEEV